MQLWQLDIVDGDHLVHGLDTKIITGADDHSRFCVLCAIVAQATGRAVCLALVADFQALRYVRCAMWTTVAASTGSLHRKGSACDLDRSILNRVLVHGTAFGRRARQAGSAVVRFYGCQMVPGRHCPAGVRNAEAPSWPGTAS
jgi:hypothetical protein